MYACYYVIGEDKLA